MAPGGAVPLAALLPAQELGSGWQRGPASREPAAPEVDPCGTGLPGADDAVGWLAARYRLTDADGEPVPEGPAYAEQVVRLPDPAAAEAAAQGLRDDVRACPRVQVPGGVEELSVAGDDPYVVQLLFTADGDEEPQPFRSWAGVVVVGDLVATWSYGDPHGVPERAARAAAADLRAALCRATGGC